MRVFGIEDCEPDWTDGRYRVYIAWGEADCIRYGRGKRYDFCISRRHHNYFHEYRARYNASYYFVYDDDYNPMHKAHVVVVGAGADGSFGFTNATNASDYDTRQLGNGLDRFLASKPGLEKARHLFLSRPLSQMDTEDVRAARAVIAGNASFASLTPTQQLMFVRLGTPLSDQEYEQAPTEIREAYISRAHLLTEQQAAHSTEAQRRRAAQLFRLFNEGERLHTAAWLNDYPLPDPAIVAAHHVPRWPSAEPAPARFGLASVRLPLAPEGEISLDSFTAGPHAMLRLARLQQAVLAGMPPRLFPVQELEINPQGAANGPVIIARKAACYVVLSGNDHLRLAQMSGEVDLVVRLATRSQLAHAYVAAS
ncbi:hypothetical protein PK28_17020 (plasmid) [Hymenobacter sp. DG25B]|nr:hypothetical protein PK28_17020 [Hymenobacter sp. DG25B]